MPFSVRFAPSRYSAAVLTLLVGIVLGLGAAHPGTVQAQPAFSKTFAPSTIGPGSVSTLEFTIDNSSSGSPVTDLAFTDVLPAGVIIATPSNATTTCSGGGGRRGDGVTLDAPSGGSTITFSGGALGGGATCTVSVDVTSSTLDTHQNVSGDLTSSAGNSGEAIADLTVAADRPGFRKSFAPRTVSLGGRSTLTFTIDNTANARQVFSLRFTDNLPSGMEVADPANAATSCGGTLTATPGSDVVTLESGFVGSGSSCTVTVDVASTASGTLGNTSDELTSNLGSSGKASAELEVTSDPLAVTKAFTDDPVPPGGTVTLEFSVTNRNRSNGATSISFTDDLDATLSGLVATGLPAGDVCGTGSQLSGTSTLSLTGGRLAPGESCRFSVSLQVPAGATPGAFANTTSSVTADVGGRSVTGNAASDDLFVAPVPRLTKTFTDDPVSPGEPATIAFTVTNTSPNFSATGISFEDVFDGVIRTASSLPADGFCGAGSSASIASFGGTNRLVVSGAELGPGASCTFEVEGDVPLDAPGGTYTNTTSEITATIDGTTHTGEPATDDLVVLDVPDLSKAFTDDPVRPGGTATLEFTLTHDGEASSDATDIAFTDDLSGALTGLGATGLPINACGGTLSSPDAGSTLDFSGGTLTPGETCTFDVALQVPNSASSGAHTNTTSPLSARVGGTSVSGAAASDDLQVAALSFSKTFADDPVMPGDAVTLDFTIENVSPSDNAVDIAFTDDLDAVLTGLAATGLPASDVCGTGSQLTGTSVLSLTGGTLPAGGSCTFSVTLQVPAGASATTYGNTTSDLTATVGGASVTLPPANDGLTVFVDPPPAFSKRFAPSTIATGDASTLTLTVDNGSATTAATTLDVTDDLPAGVAVASSPNASTTCTGGTLTAPAGAGTVTYTGGSVAAGASCTVSVDVTSSTVGTHTNTTGDLTSSLGNSGPATADLTVVSPPEFVNGASTSLTVDEDAPATDIGSLLGVDDPDVSQGLTWTVASAPSKGTLEGLPASVRQRGTGIQPSGVTYQPNANANGSDAFDVQVSDGTATDVITVNVTVNAVNDPPSIEGDLALEGTEGDAITLATADLTGTDPDDSGAGLTYTVTTAPSNGTIQVGGTAASTFTQADLEGGTVAYVHDGSETSSDAFDVSLADGGEDGAGPATATLTVSITTTNDAPTISAVADPTIDEDTDTGALAVTVGDEETAASGLQLTATSSNPALVPDANLALGGSGANRTVTATPLPDQNGTATITLTVSDGTASTSTTFDLTVTPVNDAPVAADDAYTTVEDQPLRIVEPDAGLLGNDSDVDGDALSAFVVSGPSNGTLTLDPDGTFEYVPDADVDGTDTFTYAANDGQGGTDEASVEIEIQAVNDAPTISALSAQTIPEDDTLDGLAFTIGDAETPPGSLAVSVASSNPDLLPPGGLALGGTGADRTLTAVPAPDQNGTGTLTVSVSDGEKQATASLTVTVTPVNDAPRAVRTIPNLELRVDDPTLEMVGLAEALFRDVEEDPIELASVTSSAPGVVEATRDAGVVLLTPQAEGTAQITITATDGTDEGTADPFAIAVGPATGEAPGTQSAVALVTADGQVELGSTGVTGVVEGLTESGILRITFFRSSGSGERGETAAGTAHASTAGAAAGEKIVPQEAFQHVSTYGWRGSTTARFETIDLRFALGDPDVTGIADPSAVTILQDSTGDGQFEVVTTTVDDGGTPNAPEDDALVAEDLRALGTFLFASNDAENLLPVEMAGFTAEVDGEGALLRWETASETNNAGFEVQHRAPAADAFEPLGFVEGTGTTTEPQTYRFRTERLAVGTHAFRLRQVDVDGTATLTDSVQVRVRMTEPYALTSYPNPVAAQATVELAVRSAQPVRLDLYDLMGRRVATLHDGPLPAGETRRFVVDAERLGLPSGTYFLRLRGEDVTGTARLVVVR